MTAIEQDFNSTEIHPIDMVETLAVESEWDFDRLGENQIAMAIEGAWRIYSLTLVWSGHDDMLRLICTFELDPPKTRIEEFFQLVNLVNEKIWCGAFTLWPDQKLMGFRYGLTLAGGATPTPEQVEAIILSSICACERFYPAFQLVGWGDQDAATALGIAIEKTYGTA